MSYRKCKNFSNDTLRRLVQKNLITNGIEFGSFIGFCNKNIDKQAPRKNCMFGEIYHKAIANETITLNELDVIIKKYYG